ncbi:MAG: hypothetical protein EP343_12735 [Deltaproteobacteria bacterium]|nr:MAG: hypothetical protein EP343_12735 [Deltaproteobacteria bacterium]
MIRRIGLLTVLCLAIGFAPAWADSTNKPAPRDTQAKKKGWWQRTKDKMAEWVPGPVKRGWKRSVKKWNQATRAYRALRDLFGGDKADRAKAAKAAKRKLRRAWWKRADERAERRVLKRLRLDMWRQACRAGSSRACRRWAKGSPTNMEPFQQLRDLLRRRKQWKPLYKLCQKLYAKKPKDLENSLCLADSLRELKRYPESLSIYRKLVVAHPNNGTIWLDWGRLLLLQKKYLHAEGACRRATQRMPKASSAWRCLGLALQSSQRKKARLAFEKSCSLGDSRSCRSILDVLPKSRLKRWWVWSKIRSKLLARGMARTSARGGCRMGMGAACRSIARRYRKKATLLRRYQRHREALWWLRRATQVSPREAINWRLFGLLLLKQQPSEEACLALRRSLRYKPKQPDLWLKLGSCYQVTVEQQLKRARQAYLKACRPKQRNKGLPEACRKACNLGAKEACYH